MNAFLRQEENFPDVLHTSIIGFGDIEMIRDQHSIIPGSFGGRVDWYVRTAERPQRVALNKIATLIEKTTDNRGIWQLSYNRDEIPGAYRVDRVVQLGEDAIVTGTYAITADIRQLDLTPVAGIDLVPDILNLIEGAYSRYQTITVKFKDSDTMTSALSLGATREYSTTVLMMPNIADVQLLAGKRDSRYPAGDILIRAPIPCFVSLTFDILIQTNQATPDTDAIRNALASVVNNLGFTGRLPASILCDTIHNFLVSPASLSKILMVGNIRRPNGTNIPLQSSDVLLIPEEPQNTLSARTVGFILDPENIGISVKIVDIPQI
jgi:hypothetical protein